MSNRENHKYDDIIHLPHPISKKHPRMPLSDRAAQFAPFVALTGHDASIRETARLTDEKELLSDEVIALLNEKLEIIAQNLGTEQIVQITYFVPDEKKAGGAYVTHSDVVRKIDLYEHVLIMTDGTVIPIDQIRGIEGELFDHYPEQI